MEIVRIMIPVWAVSYLEYRDDSGLSTGDKAMVDGWVKSVTDDGWSVCYDGEENDFLTHPEFGDACDCVSYCLVK